MEFAVLTTDRLVLRELRPADAADVFVFRGDPVVQRFDDPPVASVEEAARFIEEMRELCEADRVQVWAVTQPADDRVIGLVSLQQSDHSGDRYHRRAEVGYGLARSVWGRGFGSEAVRAVCRFGFEVLGLHRIFARTIADNAESVRLLERLGFTLEGQQRQHSLEDDGRFHDSAIYGLLRTEWGFAPLDLSGRAA